MDDARAQVATRIALNRGVPSLPVWSLVLVSSTLIFVLLIFALVRNPQPTLVSLGLAALLSALWWHRNSNRPRTPNWERVAYLETAGGRIRFVPDPRMRSMGYRPAEAPFSTESRLEYRIETGDRYFTRDHAQVLATSLWVVESTGGKCMLLNNAAFLNLRISITNLTDAAIPFEVVKTYNGQEGEHNESNVTAEYLQRSRKKILGIRPVISALIGTSSVWLGALAGALVKNGTYVVVIGLLGYSSITVLSLVSNRSKRSALVQLASLLPTYAAGYAVTALILRYAIK